MPEKSSSIAAQKAAKEICLQLFTEHSPSLVADYQNQFAAIVERAIEESRQPSQSPLTPRGELMQRVDDYRSGYSCGYSDGKNGARMRDKDAAQLFFGGEAAGIPDVSEYCLDQDEVEGSHQPSVGTKFQGERATGDCNDVRCATAGLTPEQWEKVRPRKSYTSAGTDYFEEISKSFIEPEVSDAKP